MLICGDTNTGNTEIIQHGQHGKQSNTDRALQTWTDTKVKPTRTDSLRINTNTLRLWRSKPSFNEESSNDDDLDDTSQDAKEVEDQDLDDKIDRMLDAEYLTAMYYPNIPGLEHEENRLKQEYFYSSATL